MSGRTDEDHANLVRLRGCGGPHLFGLIRERGEGASRARYQCERCGGEASEQAVTWYRLGLRAGLEHAERRSNAAAQRGEAAA